MGGLQRPAPMWFWRLWEEFEFHSKCSGKPWMTFEQALQLSGELISHSSSSSPSDSAFDRVLGTRSNVYS